MLLSLLGLAFSHWRWILAAVALVYAAAFLSGRQVRVPAQFRHKEMLGKLSSYEEAQLWVVVFIFLLCGAVHLKAWPFVWLASAIPVLRCHSKELTTCLQELTAVAFSQAVGLRETATQLRQKTAEEAVGLRETATQPRQKTAEEAKHLCGTFCSIAMMTSMVWVAYTSLAYARDALHPFEVYCFQFRGVDCSGSLAAWGGPGNCVILAESNGSCKAYCESYNRTCVKACDDVGTGACKPQHSVTQRQTTEENGCLQDWRTQLCVCTGFEDTLPWNQQADEIEGLSPAAAPALGDASPDPSEVAPQRPPDEPTRVPSWEVEEAEDCFLRDTQYVPLDMPLQGRTVASSPQHCQRRCYRTMGCARFTWLPLPGDQYGRGACHLQEYASMPKVVPGAIAGPSSCDDEEELAELLGHKRPPKPQRQQEQLRTQPAPLAPPQPQAQPPVPRPQPVPQAERPQQEHTRIIGEEPLMAAEESFQQISGIAQAWYAQETQWDKPILPEGNPVSLLWVFGVFMALASSGLLERRRRA